MHSDQPNVSLIGKIAHGLYLKINVSPICYLLQYEQRTHSNRTEEFLHVYFKLFRSRDAEYIF